MNKEHLIHVIVQHIIDNGESLLNDNGVDYVAARSLAEDIKKDVDGFIEKELEVIPETGCQRAIRVLEAALKAPSDDLISKLPGIVEIAKSQKVCEQIVKEVEDGMAVTQRADRDEVIAEIAYMAGNDHLTREDSRAVLQQFIDWATEFGELHKDTCWDDQDYMTVVEEFYEAKKKIALHGNEWTQFKPLPQFAANGLPKGSGKSPVEKRCILQDWVLTLRDPNTVGGAEYREIVELVKEADNIDVAKAMLEEFETNAKFLKNRLETYIKDNK